MVMPRSRSSSLLSIARSATRSLARNVPLWCSSPSTRVVLPWSTCAMIATLRLSGLAVAIPSVYRQRLLPCLDRLGQAALLRRCVERAPSVVDAAGGGVVVGERQRRAIPLRRVRGGSDQQRFG